MPDTDKRPFSADTSGKDSDAARTNSVSQAPKPVDGFQNGDTVVAVIRRIIGACMYQVAVRNAATLTWQRLREKGSRPHGDGLDCRNVLRAICRTASSVSIKTDRRTSDALAPIHVRAFRRMHTINGAWRRLPAMNNYRRLPLTSLVFCSCWMLLSSAAMNRR